MGTVSLLLASLVATVLTGIPADGRQSAKNRAGSPETAISAPEKDAAQIAAAIDRHYRATQSLQANFTETYRGASISRAESGTLWLKRPGKMRWEYHQPREKLFIIDGKTAYFEVLAERRARKIPVKHLDDLRSPLRFLLGHSQIRKEFRALSLAVDVKPLRAGNDVLRGIPANMADRVRQVLLETDHAGRIERILIAEADDSTTEFRFNDFVENLPVSDSKFKFVARPGVEVIEEKF